MELEFEPDSSVNFMSPPLYSPQCVRCRPVREVVIVISDLYVSQEEPQQWPEGVSLPGLAQVVRFGTRAGVAAGGWRTWLATRVGAASEIASAAPATVAAL